jgi:hypothetical protein
MFSSFSTLSTSSTFVAGCSAGATVSTGFAGGCAVSGGSTVKSGTSISVFPFKIFRFSHPLNSLR